MTPEQILRLRRKYLHECRRYNREEKKQGGTGANQHQQRDQIDTFAKTADRLADEYKVPELTVKRYGKKQRGVFNKVVEMLGKTGQ